MNFQRSLFLCLLAATFSTLSAQEKKSADNNAPASEVQTSKLGGTRNVHLCGQLFMSGQPEKDDLEVIAKKGVKRIISLRQDGEVDWDEAAAAKDAGMQFIPVPFRSPDSLNDEVFDKVRSLLAKDEPTLLHCGSANRVGAVWLTYRVLDQGIPLKEALQEAKKVGLRNDAYEAKAEAYIKRQQENGRKKTQSVKPGINERFLDPNLELQEWLTD